VGGRVGVAGPEEVGAEDGRPSVPGSIQMRECCARGA